MVDADSARLKLDGMMFDAFDMAKSPTETNPIWIDLLPDATVTLTPAVEDLSSSHELDGDIQA